MVIIITILNFRNNSKEFSIKHETSILNNQQRGFIKDLQEFHLKIFTQRSL